MPVGEGPASDRGVSEAIRLARETSGSVRFLHVVGGTAKRDRRAGFAGTVDDYLALLDSIEHAGAAVMAAACRRADSAGVSCMAAMRDGSEGSLADLVASEARAWRADVIVMGAGSRHGGVARSGSASAGVLRSPPVTVLAIVPRPDRS